MFLNPKPLKRVVKSLLRTNDNMTTLRHLRNNTLSRCLTSGTHFPLMKKKGKLFTNYISWLIGCTSIYENLTEDRLENRSPECRLCSSGTETRKHLLDSCPETRDLFYEFLDQIALLDKDREEEYFTVDIQDRWLWTLADVRFQHHHSHLRSEGRCEQQLSGGDGPSTLPRIRTRDHT